MVHVVTVHLSDNWIGLQNKYIRQNIPDVKIYGVLVRMGDSGGESFDVVIRSDDEPIKKEEHDHVKNANLGLFLVQDEAADDDIIILMDGDAFPIGDIEPLLLKLDQGHDMVAIVRPENGENHPHPAFVAAYAKKWKSKLTLEGHMPEIKGSDKSWFSLKKTYNKYSFHGVFFSIYGGVIYHHGAGFRAAGVGSRWNLRPDGTLIYTKNELIYMKKIMLRFINNHPDDFYLMFKEGKWREEFIKRWKLKVKKRIGV